MINPILRICVPVALAAIVLATACTPSHRPTPPREESSLPENSGIPESSSVPEASPTRPDTPVQRALDAALETAFSDSLLDLLSSKFDLTPRFSDVLADGDTFRAALLLENGAGRSYTQAVQGHLSYDPPLFPPDNIVVNWGGICLVDADTIAITSLDAVALLDARTLEEKPFPPDLSVLEQTMSVVGVGRVDGQFIVAVVDRIWVEGISIVQHDASFLLFDSDGTLADTISIGRTGGFSRYHSSQEREILCAEQIFVSRWEGRDFLVMPNLTLAVSMDGAQGARCLFATRTDRDDRTLLVADLPLFGGVAFLYEGEAQVSAVALPRSNPGIFGVDELGAVRGDTAVDWADPRRVTISNSYYDTEITLDFAKADAFAVYALQPDHISRYSEAFPPPQSTDGRYRIITSSGWGGADGLFSNAWLEDMERGQAQFFDVFTSVYGGSGDHCAFFDSDRFYRMDFPGQLMIYQIIDSAPHLLHLLSDNAIAMTYAADRGQYYVLELDGESPSVNVAIWNDAGGLVGRHNTAIPVTTHYEGLHSPLISVSGNTMEYRSPHLEVLIEGTLDLTTFEYVETSREPLRQ